MKLNEDLYIIVTNRRSTLFIVLSQNQFNRSLKKNNPSDVILRDKRGISYSSSIKIENKSLWQLSKRITKQFLAKNSLI